VVLALHHAEQRVAELVPGHASILARGAVPDAARGRAALIAVDAAY
jgi:hypothetical protein